MVRASVLVLALLAACPAADDSEEITDATDPDLRPRGCIAPPGLGAPTDIAALVELIDALPHPVTLPCLLESFDRPLEIYASSSTAGAQPALGQRSPRIFVRIGALSMSLVPDGDGRDTLELAQDVGARRSIKAELGFPIAESLAPGAPYARVAAGSGTVCGACHGEERSEPAVDPGAYSSDVFQDDPSQALPLALVRQYFRDCDAMREPERCARLDALFGHGEVVAGELSRLAKVCRAP